MTTAKELNKWLVRVGVPSLILSTAVAGHAAVPKTWATGDPLVATDLNANFAALVDLSTSQTVTGAKTFNGSVSVSGANSAGNAILQVTSTNPTGNPLLSGIQVTDPFFPQLVLRTATAATGLKTWRFISRTDGSAQLQTLNDTYTTEVSIIDMKSSGAVIVKGTLTVPSCSGCTAAPSDTRLKTNVRPIAHALDDVNKLRGVRFDWKKDGRASMGVIAQEIETVYPELVITDSDGMKAVEYGQLAGALIEATKELDARNKELERKNVTLMERLERIERVMGISTSAQKKP